MRRAVLVAITFLALGLAVAVAGERGSIEASTPGTVAAPLISCPNVNGDPGGAVAASDINQTIMKFGTAFPNLTFSYLYDRNADHAVSAPDINQTITRFGDLCPLVDTQVAQATLAGLALGPAVIDCDHAAMLAAGYTLSSTIDAPGQGVHYGNNSYSDAVFDITHPEGLVCDNMGGRLVAQLYYVEGDPAEGGVGWGPVVPPPPDFNNIDLFCSPQPCSWSGSEYWHVHYNLCYIKIGTPQAFVLPQPNAAACETLQCSPDPVPCGAIEGEDWEWKAIVGWMGHLWNHKLNPNLVPDNGGMNGRFADCTPDGQGWKAYTCPQ